MSTAAAPAGAGSVAAEAEPVGEIIPDELIVAFHDGIPADVDAWLAANGATVVHRDDVLNFVTAKFESVESTDAFSRVALEREDVRAVDPNGKVSITLTPNDPLYGSQWGFPAIKAPQAWDTQLGSKSVKVAVLDTGIQTNHPDLAANICGPFSSFVPSEPTIADGNGHGTHVAGTIAAVTNNGLGVAGTSQSCIMGSKVLNSWGSGQWDWVASGIRWAADNGAHVISMSLGGGSPPTIMKDAVTYAYTAKGVLVVSAAGNAYCGAVGYPAAYPESMAIAALAPGNVWASFSSCGSKVELSAPGQGVLSTWIGSRYISISGTSMATPHVSGVAALVKSSNPGLTNVQLRCVLDLTADDIGSLGRDTRTGVGVVNAQKAIALTLSPGASTPGALSGCLLGR